MYIDFIRILLGTLNNLIMFLIGIARNIMPFLNIMRFRYAPLRHSQAVTRRIPTLFRCSDWHNEDKEKLLNIMKMMR